MTFDLGLDDFDTPMESVLRDAIRILDDTFHLVLVSTHTHTHTHTHTSDCPCVIFVYIIRTYFFLSDSGADG